MRKVLYVFALLTSLLFTSCFEMVEEISLEKNGSGTAKTIIDMGETMAMLGMFMPDSLKETMDLATIFDKDVPRYENMNGISNVRVDQESEYRFSLAYDFEDMDALNAAMAQGAEGSSEGGKGSAMLGVNTDYGLKGKKFNRVSSIAQNSSNMMDEMGIGDEEMEQVFEMLSKPTYKIVYKFPRKVKKVKISDKDATVEKDDRKVTVEYDLMEFMSKQGKVMDHFIKF